MIQSSIFTGQFQHKFGEWSSAAFEYEPISDQPERFGKLLPVYPLGGSLGQKTLRKAVLQALREYTPGLREELPAPLCGEYGFPSRLEALKAVHNPENPGEAQKARDYFIYEELFHLQTAVGRNALRQREYGRRESSTLNRELEQRLKKELPFTLTDDQGSVLDDIASDLGSGRPMNRLIQGDVGSGKTLVAFIAALNVIRSGRQAALMAPTELLARQHADNASKLLSPLGISIAYLSGNTQGEGRRHLLDALSDGKIDFVLGTHALFSEDVAYKDLGAGRDR